MLDVLTGVHADERRAVAAGFVTLMALMSGHLLVETARDALFLASIPATQLPLLYLVIAAVALGLTQLQKQFDHRWQTHYALIGWLVFGASGSVALWASLEVLGDAGLYILYVLPGVISTVTMLQFWVLVGNALTVDDAKRIYILLGAGGGVGAIVGSAAATGLSTLLPASSLLLAGAVAWGLTPVGVLVLADALPDQLDKQDFEQEPSAGWSAIVGILREPYTRSVALLSALIPMAATVGDYLFKSLAADRIAAESLGTFFGSVYLVLNVISLAVQLLVVRRAVQRLSIAGAVAILPGLLAVGGIGVAAGFAFVAAVGIKIADGSLRHSLHATAKELLFVPLSTELRDRMKSVGSTVGKRGGQAVGSLGLLGLLGVGADPALIGGLLVVLAAGAATVALRLRRPYLDLFRSRLSGQRVRHLLDYPELDADQLEQLVSRLSSPEDAEVLAALDLLEAEGRVRAIPALILYHPSDRVVMRALAIFIDARVEEVIPVIERLEHQADPALHAALLSARAALDPGEAWLVGQLDHDSELVRSTAAFHLIAHGWRTRQELNVDIGRIVQRGEPSRQRALAFAIGVARAREFLPELVDLLEADDPGVQQQAVRALTRMRDDLCRRVLLDRLADRHLRDEVIQAFLSMGPAGLDYLIDSLGEEEILLQARRQIPRAIGAFEEPRGAEALATHLPELSDPALRAPLLDQLERARQLHEQMTLPVEPLQEALGRVIEQAYRWIGYQQRLAETSTDDQKASSAYQLLQEWSAGQERRAVDHVLRIAGLLFAADDVRRARQGLESPQRVQRASGRELLEAALPARWQDRVLGLVAEQGGFGRLQHAPEAVGGESLDRRRLFGRLLASGDGAVLLVARLAGRFGIEEAHRPLADCLDGVDGEIAEAVAGAVARLEELADTSVGSPATN